MKTETFATDSSMNFINLEHYDSRVLDRIGEADGYANQEDVERPGQPLDLSNPTVPVELASHILDCHSSDLRDENQGYWCEAWADSLFQTGFFYAAGLRIAGGSDEILRNIIAERVLGLPGDIRVDRDKPFSEVPSRAS